MKWGFVADEKCEQRKKRKCDMNELLPDKHSKKTKSTGADEPRSEKKISEYSTRTTHKQSRKKAEKSRKRQSEERKKAKKAKIKKREQTKH